MASELEPSRVRYALEQLYQDQPKDWVIDAIPALLAWLEPTPDRWTKAFAIAHTDEVGAREQHVTLALDWDVAKLALHDPHVLGRAARYRTGRTVQREQVAQYAAYGLALVAISVLMPGREVVGMQIGTSPDILLDTTPGALRGVEVAGRSKGGRGALRSIRLGSSSDSGKAAQLLANIDVVEAHLSLWCASPSVAEFVRVKP